MRIDALRERCIGAGNCVAVSGAYFDLDDEGLVVVRQAEVATGDEGDVERAAGMCPAMAIELVD